MASLALSPGQKLADEAKCIREEARLKIEHLKAEGYAKQSSLASQKHEDAEKDTRVRELKKELRGNLEQIKKHKETIKATHEGGVCQKMIDELEVRNKEINEELKNLGVEEKSYS